VLRRLLRFGVVGALTAAIHFGLLFLGVEILGLGSTLASSIGFVVCVIFNYLMHYSWTFATPQGVEQLPHGQALTRYAVMIACGFTLNALIMYVGVHGLAWHYFPTQVIAAGSVILWNILVSNFWVFRH
jgi:putative flippase GtrA